jgi:seryl-tRNA(Sec) selenium transferase
MAPPKKSTPEQLVFMKSRLADQAKPRTVAANLAWWDQYFEEFFIAFPERESQIANGKTPEELTEGFMGVAVDDRKQVSRIYMIYHLSLTTTLVC